MRILIAPQSLKGSLSASATGSAIEAGVRLVFPEADIEMIPIADGGEGTVEALVEATSGRIIEQTVTGPLGEPVRAFWGIMGDGQTAVIEMAASSGLPLVPIEKRDPTRTTTYGVGELIKAALDHGCQRFILGIGGSATNDGGAGMAQALGASLLTERGEHIATGGAALQTLATINIDQLDPRLSHCYFDVACDVTNPLCGPIGATAIYGPQKGANAEMIHVLDTALAHYASIIQRDLGKDIASEAGSGAAGGLGAGLLAFMPAILRPGAQIVLDALHLEEHIQQADLIISAEGQIDAQTSYGKSISALATLAKCYVKPTLALAGGLGENYQVVYQSGVDAIMALPSGPMPLVYSMEHAKTLMIDATERALKLIKLGMEMKEKREK